MSCEDKSSNIEDVVSEINKDLTLDKIALSQAEELAKNNPELMDVLAQHALCELPSDPIFTKSQLDSLGCDIGVSTKLPDVPSKINFDIPVPKDSGFKCQKALDEANVIIKREQKEYSDLNILYNKLVEYQDNHDLLLSYFSARSREINRLMNKFQPILEEIRRLEKKIEKLNNERLETKRLLALARTALAVPLIAILDVKLLKIRSKLNKTRKELDDQREYLQNQTDSESILKDRNIKYISTRYSNGTFISPFELRNTFNNVLDSQGAGDIKASILAYSSAINISLDLPGNLNTFISNSRTYKFNLSFVGIDYIQSEEDIYNEETGKRNTITVNFPIRENTKLQKNNYFKPSSGISINNAPIGTQFIGALYTQYYDKLNDPVARLFTLSEKGLTNQETLVDPSLKSTGLSKKREGTSEYFIRDFDKMQAFYKDLEINIESKKEKIRREIVEPAFNTASENVKKLGKMDIKLLLAIGRINVDLVRESQNLQSIIEAVAQSQIDFVEKSKNLTSEITRIEKRMLEIKPTPERIKQILVSISSECFSQGEEAESPAELESKTEDVKGNDPFGIKSLEKTDPTMPTLLDYKYWLQFSMILNQVALLPFPKDPMTLRYWPVGLFFPTPAGTLIKIPLPIIWIPLLVIPSPTGVTVIFLTINGLFISPIIFKIDSTGSKYHQLTVRGPSARFGYTQDPIKPTIKIPLSIASAKDALLNAGQNPLSKLTVDAREAYEAESKSIQEKLNRIGSGSSRNKKLTQKLNGLKESVSLKTETEKLQQSIDTKESAIDAIEKAKASIKDRMNQLGEPDFSNSLAIQQSIQTNRESLRKRIDETYKLDIPPVEKRKKLKQLRKEIASEGVPISEKKEALSKDIMSFFDKIKLPTISIPRDSTKINPAPNALVQLKEDSNEQLSDFKNDPTAPNNKNIKQSMKRELGSVLDIINVDDIPTEINGKIDIAEQTGLIKKKLKEITTKLSDKLKGESRLNVNEAKIESVDLERKIDNETDPIKRRLLTQKLNINNAKLSNHNEAEQLKIDNAMSPSKLSETASTKFTFNAFKSLTDLLPTEIDFSADPASLAPINSAQVILNGYISSLDSDSLKSMFGGQTQISPNTIKDLYFNIINENVPSNLNIPTKINQKDILSSSSGVLSSIAIPTIPSPFLTPFTLPKKLSIDLNLLIGPLRKLLTQEIENLITCMPVDIENNFNSLNSTDLKSELESKVLNLLDSLISIIDPFYTALSILKSTKGINLTTDQLTSFLAPPFGPIDFAKFTAESLIKMNLPTSANTSTFDLGSLDQAKKLIEPVVSPIMDNPVSFIIPVAAASVGMADIQRQLHPVLNADDIPPWERLSSKNFLFVLFLDEFISQAADKVGFFRTFI